MAKKSFVGAVTLLLSGLVASGTGHAIAQDHRNPVDRIANPEALNYPDVVLGVSDLTERFQRDGPVQVQRFFAAVRLGMAQAEIRSLLGEPLWQGRSGAREWNYNFKFQMPDSANYLVCQYKVVFGADELVSETVWRRRQCQQLANGTLAAR